jgi:hypothetical protein
VASAAPAHHRQTDARFNALRMLIARIERGHQSANANANAQSRGSSG